MMRDDDYQWITARCLVSVFFIVNEYFCSLCYKSIHLPGYRIFLKNGKTPAAQSTMDQLSAIHQLTPLKGQTGEFNNTDHPDTIQWSWWETLEPGIHVDDSYEPYTQTHLQPKVQPLIAASVLMVVTWRCTTPLRKWLNNPTKNLKMSTRTSPIGGPTSLPTARYPRTSPEDLCPVLNRSDTSPIYNQASAHPT